MKPKKYAGSFLYGGKQISFSYWLVDDGLLNGSGYAPDTVIFLGAGQVGAIGRWVAAAAGPRVVVVDGLPHWESQPTAPEVTKFSTAYVQRAFTVLRRGYAVESMNIIAESQAAPAAVILARKLPGEMRNLLLIRPLGFTVQAFGGSTPARLQTFRRRIRQTYLQFPQSFLHDPRNVSVLAIVVRAMLREPSRASFNQKYAAGISYDLLEDCRETAKLQKSKGASFSILLGQKDRIFPPHEVLAALHQAGITDVNVDIVPGASHSSLAVRASRPVLARALATVRSGE